MRILLLSAATFIVVPLSLFAFKEGPYPNVTGGFGEQSCHVCHFDNPVNAPGGTLRLDTPAKYQAGRAYAITVTLLREDLERGGFEIAARYASGRQRGKQAGSWRLLDQRVQLVPSQNNSITFAQHTLAGSRAAERGTQRWTLEWIAPDSAAAPVQFNVAANASNGDDSPLGDYIYLRAARSVNWKNRELEER